METRERLIAGGRHGAALTAGRGAKSLLVQYLTGEMKPKMPPNGAVDLDRIAIIRRWIDEGARVDSMNAPAGPASPSIPALRSAPVAVHAAPVTALAFSPDGKQLAAGGYRAVRLLDPKTGELLRTIPGPADQVQALAWSGDGSRLAAAGGVPGLPGEVLIFDTERWRPMQTLVGHLEVVCAVAWKPGSMEIATGSLDKTARIWDAATGRLLHTIKDHADTVFGVAYSPNGKLLATASGDRTAKLFDAVTWRRTDTLNAHQEAVTHVAFNSVGTLLATAGADKALRVWKVDPGKMENPLRSLGEGDAINSCAFSPDDKLLAFGASNGTVRLFGGDGASSRREWKDAGDWVYAVAVGADGDTVAAGTQEGRVVLWSAKDGKPRRIVTLSPQGVRIVPAADSKR